MHPSRGQRAAEKMAQVIGSWRFLAIQSCLLALWVALNVVGWVRHWDPYPFILLNLALSFQAAYTGPILLIASNRQEERDRRRIEQILHLAESAEKTNELHEDLLRQAMALLHEALGEKHTGVGGRENAS